MKITYFEDTDTAQLEFSDHPVSETRELTENLYLDLDARGNVVNMTIEHASVQADIHEFAFQRVAAEESVRRYARI
ncbi:MAG: DUF2283 domain-containing protein [Candidatus Thiosymbion ectosymbiont of Robbea hypermnestra]|nr:DUF2283 domain-containing protein [Candidatus Thiosymbion ectosymbiont of Robbea hypermnestra]